MNYNNVNIEIIKINILNGGISKLIFLMIILILKILNIIIKK